MLNLDTTGQLHLDVKDLVGQSGALLGITGSGKTNSAAVLIEELLGANLPLTVVDIEGEYWGLKEKFEVLVAGQGEHVDFEAGVGQAAALAQLSVQKEIPVILDLSGFADEDDRFEFLLTYLQALWDANFNLRKPYAIFLEEAHEFVPQGMNSPLKSLIKRLASRGRKRGFSVMLMSQRSQKVEKEVLTQAGFYLLHRVVHPLDLKIYKEILPLEGKEVEDKVRALKPGQALMLFNNEVKLVQIRLRHTFHAGATPALDQEATARLIKIDAALLKELEKLVVAGSKRAPGDESGKAARRIKELEGQLTESQAEVARLSEQLAIVSRLKLSVEGLATTAPLVNPTTLNVDQAIVRQLITGNGGTGNGATPPKTEQPTKKVEQAKATITAPPAPAPRPAIVSPANPTKLAPSAIAKPDPALRTELNPIEEKRLAKALAQLKALRPIEVVVFETLLNNQGKQLDYDQLAKWTGYARRSFQRRELARLYKTPFVMALRRDKTDLWQSNVLEFAAAMYPGVAPEVIVEKIKAAL